MNLSLQLVRNDLFPVYETGKKSRAVSLRDVWAALDSGKDFSAWAKAKIKEHRLAEGTDYITDRAGENPLQGENAKTGRRRVEYILPLRTAKIIAMGINTPAGDAVKDYFLRCEEIAQAAVAAGFNPAPPAPRNLPDFTAPTVQIECVKQVGAALYTASRRPDPIMEHHRAVCQVLTGKRPSGYVKGWVAKGRRVKSLSARAVMRRFEPALAATAAFFDDAVARGKQLAQLESAGLAAALPAAFAAMLRAGYSDGEVMRMAGGEKNLS